MQMLKPVGRSGLLLLIGLVALLLTLAAVMANDRQQGWTVQFFEEGGVVFPLAMLDAQGDPAAGGSLFVACASEGPVVFYQDRFVITDGTLEMELQSRDEVLRVTFQVDTVPFFGHRLRLEADASREFLWALIVMENNAVGYRTESQTGLFPTVGTDRIAEIFELACLL